MGRCTLSHHGMNNECSPFLNKKSWSLSNKPEAVSDGVNPYREEFLDKNYPGIRENEYKKTED